MHPPPLTSKRQTGPSDYEIKQQRLEERREKARVRMARKRAELKSQPWEEQQKAAERERMYQATYRERNRADLRVWEAQRRLVLYKERFGPVAYTAYAKQRRECRRQAREKRRAKEGYYDERTQLALDSESAPVHQGD